MSQTVSIRRPATTVTIHEPASAVAVSVGSAPTPLGAHLGLIAGSTLYDPSGILVAASDLEDGSGVRIEVNGGLAATPGAGVSWSTLLRRPDGGAHPVMPTLQRFPLFGSMGIDELSPWSTKATPSNSAAFVGVFDGPLSTAERGLYFAIRNNVAGQQRVGMGRLHNSAWTHVLWSNTSDADQAGVDGGVGNGGGVPNGGYSLVAQVRSGWDGTHQQRALTTLDYYLRAGVLPYLVFGVFQPTAGAGGSIDIAPLAELWPARLPTARA